MTNILWCLLTIILSRKALATIKSHDRVLLLLLAPRLRSRRKETAIVIAKSKLKAKEIVTVTMTVTEDDAARNHSATADFATILDIHSSATEN